MIAPDFLLDGASDASLTVCLAHGAGAPMDSPFMQAFAEGIAAAGLRARRASSSPTWPSGGKTVSRSRPTEGRC